jgi:hypothetical protein
MIIGAWPSIADSLGPPLIYGRLSESSFLAKESGMRVVAWQMVRAATMTTTNVLIVVSLMTSYTFLRGSIYSI